MGRSYVAEVKNLTVHGSWPNVKKYDALVYFDGNALLFFFFCIFLYFVFFIFGFGFWFFFFSHTISHRDPKIKVQFRANRSSNRFSSSLGNNDAWRYSNPP